MTDKQKEALMVVFSLLPPDKTYTKEKQLWEKSWRWQECGLYAFQPESETFVSTCAMFFVCFYFLFCRSAESAWVLIGFGLFQ